MKQTILRLYDFFQDIEHLTKGIEIESSSLETINNFVSGMQSEQQDEIQWVTKEIKDKTGLVLNKSQKNLFFIEDAELIWTRPAQESGEGYLSGGFYINGPLSIFLNPAKFWEDSLSFFEEIGKENLADIPINLRWIESTSLYTEPSYNPHFGCVKFIQGVFPNEFYFYDSGFLFPLPFTTFQEYFNAMIDSAAVKCWQYFYIEPETILNRNINKDYYTWALHISTNLDEKLRSIKYFENAKFDRLDLIAEYLKRCVRLLPGSFPFLTFDHHKEYFEGFRKLYNMK